MNLSEIYAVQDILFLHADLRDALHNIKEIVPDDQRIINEIHTKITNLFQTSNTDELQEIQIAFETLRVLFAEYEKNEVIDAYMKNCCDILSMAVQKT